MIFQLIIDNFINDFTYSIAIIRMILTIFVPSGAQWYTI